MTQRCLVCVYVEGGGWKEAKNKIKNTQTCRSKRAWTGDLIDEILEPVSDRAGRLLGQRVELDEGRVWKGGEQM